VCGIDGGRGIRCGLADRLGCFGFWAIHALIDSQPLGAGSAPRMRIL